MIDLVTVHAEGVTSLISLEKGEVLMEFAGRPESSSFLHLEVTAAIEEQALKEDGRSWPEWEVLFAFIKKHLEMLKPYEG